jgi:hypothetical protein
MTIQKVLRGVTPPLAGLVLALAAFAPAQAATAPGWRVATLVGPSGTMLSSVVATSKTDAWSAGTTITSRTQTDRLLVEHFDGRRWRQFPVPTRLQAIRLGSQVLIGASSASNVWVFELLPAHPRMLRWNGRQWIVMSAPSWAFRGGLGGTAGGAVAVFRTATWVFSFSARALPSDAARYTHGRWELVKLPAIPTSVAAVSASAIWAFGTADDLSHPVIMHWNGRSWASAAAPGRDQWGSIVSDSPNTVWIENTTSLEYWSGKAWTTTALPSSLGLTLISTDGHGGAWLWGLHRSGAFSSTPYVLAHYSDGAWTQRNAPAEHGNDPIPLAAEAQVPGSTTIFAAGWVSVTSAGPVGAILQYRG